jgi:hypothetical protein
MVDLYCSSCIVTCVPVENMSDLRRKKNHSITMKVHVIYVLQDDAGRDI